jgi:hypothetical protein
MNGWMIRLMICFVAGVLLAACSGDDGGKQGSPRGDVEKTVPVSGSDFETVHEEPGSEEQVIEDVINDVLARLKHKDKTGLFENEFQYLRDQDVFDDYLKHGQVNWAQADTIEFVDVHRVDFFREDDSAVVKVVVSFYNPNTGNRSVFDDVITVYRHEGRWIKPTVSVRPQQDQYDELQRVADSMARLESEYGQ